MVVVDDGSGMRPRAPRTRPAPLSRATGATGARPRRWRREPRSWPRLEREAGEAPRALLFLDADLEGTAAAAGALIPPVLAGEADMTIAILPTQRSAGGGRGFVVRLSSTGIERATGWSPTQPLSGQRCLTREAFRAAQPLARGFGVETALSVDLLRQGFRVREVEVDLHHRVTGTGWRDQVHRARQYRDVALALSARRLHLR